MILRETSQTQRRNEQREEYKQRILIQIRGGMPVIDCHCKAS